MIAADSWPRLNDMDGDIGLLRQGLPPRSDALLEELTVGQELWAGFFLERVLDAYVGLGGSKVKFLVGPAGTGKTHALRYLCLRATQSGFESCYVDLTTIRMQQFQQLFGTIAASLDVPRLIAAFAPRVIRRCGYDPAEVATDLPFVDWMTTQRARPREALVREVRDAADDEIAGHQFASPFGRWVRAFLLDYLGARPLPPVEKAALLDWVRVRKTGRRDLKANDIYAPIDRVSARAMLRSLLAFLRACGRKGLFVAVDNLEDLIALLPSEVRRRWKYTRAARTDAYESIRQLIDDVDEMGGACFVFGADALLLADEVVGLPSYNALWLRIQKEVVTADFNRFADIVEAHRILAQWTPAHEHDLGARLSRIAGHEGPASLPGLPSGVTNLRDTVSRIMTALLPKPEDTGAFLVPEEEGVGL